MSKSIHIVFQVLNFLSSPASLEHNLTNDEKLLLIFLAKHKGIKGIYPCVHTLSRELNRDYRNVRRTIQRLKQKELLSVDQNSGYSNHYTLLFVDADIQENDIQPEKLSTGGGVHIPPPRASAPGGGGRPRPGGEGVHAPLYNTDINNKERERARVLRPHPLTDDFRINAESRELAMELGYTQDEANQEKRKFIAHYMSTGAKRADWNKAIQKWLMDSMERRQRNSFNYSSKADEVHSTVPFYRPDPLYNRSAPTQMSNLMSNITRQGSLHGRVESTAYSGR